MAKTFVVLGNARSGTTLATGILKALGIAMDADYGEPGIHAPKGFYESLDAHLINTKIFQLAAREAVIEGIDAHWSPPEHQDILAQKPFIEQDIIDFVKKFSAQHELWGFKNPKTSLTIDLFLPHLENPHFIITQRNPLTNAIACHKIFRLPFDYTYKVVNYYNYRIAEFYMQHDYPTVFLNFEEIRAHPMQIAEKLAEFIQIEFDAEKRERIQEFVVDESKKRALYWQDENRAVSSSLKIPEISYPSHHLISPMAANAGAYSKFKRWVKQFTSLNK
ncbi:MAG: sulfotransferase [Thiotrichaceae bacterium]|nr:sulfotransferase [Thiotrichaceae bacterium]